MTAITSRYDFVILMDVHDGNPNGDPDAGNMPRFDPETGQGLISDGCIKRKLRNYVEIAKNGTPGYQIYIREGSVLNREHELAFSETGIRTKETKKTTRQKGESGQYENVEARRQLKPADETERAKVVRAMCEKFYDIRTVGAVMTTEMDIGQVRGPVQFTWARSVDPIYARDVAITRCAVTNERDLEKERTMGRKHLVAYGLYRAHGFISVPLAEKFGFSPDDLSLLWEALSGMFEHDRSAARGMMTMQRLVVFEHGSRLGKAHAHDLFRRVNAERIDTDKPPRDISDYRITLDGQELSDTVTMVSL